MEREIKTKINCPICSGKDSNKISSSLRRGEGKVYYCEKCNHGFLVDYTINNYKEYYSKNYRQKVSHKSSAAATSPREIYEVYKNFQQDRLTHVQPYLALNKNLLEIGASAGQFLCHIKNQVNKVFAVELDESCCRYLTSEFGIEADSNFLENSRFTNHKFDIVCAFQVMEHTEKPIEFLKVMRQYVKKGGTIFVEVPNINDPLISVWNNQAYQKFFYHSDHLHYFSEISLLKIIKDAGFQESQIEFYYTQDYNLLNHLNWIMNEQPQEDCILGLSEINLFGVNKDVSTWLSEEMRMLNKKYIDKLINLKCTSNILLKITCE